MQTVGETVRGLIAPGVFTPRGGALRRSVASRDAGLAVMGLVAFLVWLGVVGPHHEPWFDEAQAWLIARDLDPWTIATQVARYEGTPSLWHLLLWAFQRLGVQYASIWMVSGGLSAIGASLVLFASPFPIWMRLGVVFAYPVAYQYAFVARSYALDVALVPAIATLFSHRLKRPGIYGLLLGLLANANAHGFVLAAPLAAEFAWALLRLGGARRLVTTPGAWLYALLAMAAAAQAAPPHDPSFEMAGRVGLNPTRLIVLLDEAFIDAVWPFTAFGFAPHLSIGGMALTLSALTPCGLLCRAAGRGWLALGVSGGLAAFTLLVYANYWHSGVFYLALVLCLWISWPAVGLLRPDRRMWLKAGVGVLLAYEGVYALTAGLRDLRETYSPGRAVAATIAVLKQRRPADTFAAFGFKTFAVQPWFSANPFADFVEPRGGGAFYRWSTKETVPLYEAPAAWSSETASRRWNWLLLSTDNRGHDMDSGAYIRTAARSGYVLVGAWPGEMIWKSRVVEPDGLLLFERRVR